MKSMPKWLLVPPAVALLLLLGPLSMQGGSARAATTAATRQPTSQQPESEPAPTPAQAAAPGKARAPLAAPRSPDLLQMGSAFVAVLLLGVGGLLVLRKLRGGAAPSRGTPLATLRQTLRLSGKQAVHAIEFDDRILLVGEHERGLVLLDSGKLPERAADEAEVLARQAAPAPVEPDDDGATPKNLLIPRPDAPVRHRLPTPPALPGTPGAAARATPGLNDFRALLQKAGRA